LSPGADQGTDRLPVLDDSSVTSRGVRTGHVVNYPLRAWFPTWQPALAGPQGDLADRIQQALRAGLLRVAGHPSLTASRRLSCAGAPNLAWQRRPCGSTRRPTSRCR
jgi:hypothetical protein